MHEGSTMKIEMNTAKIVTFLSVAAAVFILANIIMLIIYFSIGDPDKFPFIQLIDLDQEANLPTLFSSIILLVSAFLFYLLSKNTVQQRSGDKRYWFGLSLVFLFLSFDESAMIHEDIGDFISQFINASGYLYYPWFVIYSLLIIILGGYYIRFFFEMDRKLFLSFIRAAIIYLSGAIGFDLLGSKEISIHGADTLLYCIYFTIEESLEMFGVIYLIWILLNLLDGCNILLTKKR
jgi:hypothetical protein